MARKEVKNEAKMQSYCRDCTFAYDPYEKTAHDGKFFMLHCDKARETKNTKGCVLHNWPSCDCFKKRPIPFTNLTPMIHE